MRCFVMLRGVLSRVIERLITLDRVLFMHEQGVPAACAQEIFDPRISPRNSAIVAAWREGRDGSAEAEGEAPPSGALDVMDPAAGLCKPCDWDSEPPP